MNDPARRIAAVAVMMALIALVACDLSIKHFATWWDQHSLTGSVVSSLFVVAVTALIFDEVIARHQRRDRATSVAVQALIVYSQSRRTYEAVTKAGNQEEQSTGASDELRTLASMLLTASPSLFNDPIARTFLEQVEQFTGSVQRTISASTWNVSKNDKLERLSSEMKRLKTTIDPLLARIPSEDRVELEDSSQH
jgi:hypothetical protein